MRLEDFLARLEKVAPNGDGYVACCPAHEDKNPSMSVSEHDGKILVHCHAGCTAEDIVGAMGLELRDLFVDDTGKGGKRRRASDGGASERKALSPADKMAKDTTRTRKSGSPGKRVCAYTYRGPDGAVLFEVVRYVKPDGKKTFLAYRPKKDGNGFEFGIHDKTTRELAIPMVVPYHLPQILAAGKAGKSLVICEGEKDVGTVEGFGFTATCNPFGAGKWGEEWPAEWGKWFAGLKGICIVADKDPETIKRKKRGKMVDEPFLVGQRHACDVRRQLREAGVTCPIKLMVMPDVGETHVKDVTDWLEARQRAGLPAGRTEFQAAVKDAAEWPAAWDDVDAHGGAGASGGPDVARDVENARDASSSDAAEIGTCRYGRPCPPSPGSNSRAYEVDFRTGGYRTVEIKLSRDAIWNVRKDVDEDGRETERAEWREVPLPMMIAHARWMAEATMSKDVHMSAEMTNDLTAIVCLMWLRSRGKFFWMEGRKDFKTSLYFDEVRGVLMTIQSNEFQAFLATVSQINREKKTWKYLLSLVDDAALDADVSQGVTPSNLWDRRGDAVYLSTGDAEMYRLKDGKIDRVQNGTDGVVFMRGKTLLPWTLQVGPGIDPFATAKIFTGASWMDKTGPMNVRLWVLNLFACHATKPILLITGLAQSGKTRMAKAIKEIIGVRTNGVIDLSVQEAIDGDKGREAFWASVNDGKLEVFDNLDTKVKWVGNSLQTAATDGQIKMRELYSNYGVAVLKANANLILTSNNPLFATEGAGGMADRIITINLRSVMRERSLDGEIAHELATNREQYLTWITRTVAAALADDRPVEASINKRHPDYGEFSIKCARACGFEDEAMAAMGAAEADKCLLPLRNDYIMREILGVLGACGNSLRFTSGEMSARILARCCDDEADEKMRQMYSARRVGKAISRYARQIEMIFKFMPPRIVDGRTVYEVTGLTPLGEMQLTSQVGVVGLNGDFAETCTGGSAHGDFSQTISTNPLNPLSDAPPYARAPAPDIPFSVEENNSRGGSGQSEESGGGTGVDDSMEDDDDLVF